MLITLSKNAVPPHGGRILIHSQDQTLSIKSACHLTRPLGVQWQKRKVTLTKDSL